MATSRKPATPRKTPASRSRAKPAAKSVPKIAAVARPDAAPPAPKAEAPMPKVVKVSAPVVAAPDLKKKELIDLVVERADIKKKYAKPAVEAVLEILGQAIAEGRELNLQPLGKLRINRAEEKANGRVIVCKLRQSLSSPEGGATEARADSTTETGGDSAPEAAEGADRADPAAAE